MPDNYFGFPMLSLFQPYCFYKVHIIAGRLKKPPVA